MKQGKLISSLVFIVFLQATFLPAQRNIVPNDDIRSQLKAFQADYTRAVLEKRTELIQPYLADNVRLMVEFQRTMFGKENLKKYHLSFSKRFDIKSYARNEMEVLDLGTMVVEHGSFVMRVISKKNGNEEWRGKYQNIWEKSKSGKLLLITVGWNYDHPITAEEELRFPEIPVVDIALQPHVPINNTVSFELAALNRLQEASISQHDAKIWSQFYADDAILFSQRRPLYRGREAIDGYMEMHVKETPVFEKLDIRNDRIDDLGEYVIEYASHIAVWRNGERSGVNLGKDLRLWRREANGSLKIFRHIGMYD